MDGCVVFDRSCVEDVRVLVFPITGEIGEIGSEDVDE